MWGRYVVRIVVSDRQRSRLYKTRDLNKDESAAFPNHQPEYRRRVTDIPQGPIDLPSQVDLDDLTGGQTGRRQRRIVSA